MNCTNPWIRLPNRYQRDRYRCDCPRHPSYLRILVTRYRITFKHLPLKMPKKSCSPTLQTVSASTDSSQSDPPTETDGDLEETAFE
jgi:hypothetical protein